MIRATHHGLPRGKSPSRGRAVQVYDLVCHEDVFMIGKIQGRSAQLVDSRIMQREDGNVMGHHPTETTRNSREQLSQVEIRDQRVVDLQQKLGTIAFSRQLFLMTLCVDRDGDLTCKQPHKLEIKLVEDAGFFTPKVKYAQLMVGRRQGKAANCLDGMIGNRFGKRKAIFERHIM